MPASLVSVMMCTYNRRESLRVAIRSVLDQTHRDFELVLVRDGGEDISDVVRSFDDDRILYLARQDNRGKGASLNEGLAAARGKYVAYLDDDDKWYPHHLETLLAALQEHPECGAAYTDLLKAHYRPTSSGDRQVLAKALDVRRDFDRFFLFYFNHVLHVSLMHERGLLERAGPYSETLPGLIDWDMVRRLSFFADFIHVPGVTGEYYAAIESSDRLSVKVRKNVQDYLKIVLEIRSNRPKKPWPKVQDLAITVIRDRMDDEVRQTLCDIRLWTFYPYEVVLVMPDDQLRRVPEFESLPMRRVPSDPDRSAFDNLEYAACLLDAELVATVPRGTKVGEMWVERAVHRLVCSPGERLALALAGGVAERPLVLPREVMLDCIGADTPTIEAALVSEGVPIEAVRTNNGPFVFDTMLATATRFEGQGKYAEAADVYKRIIRQEQNVIWMRYRLAQALFHLKNYEQSLAQCRAVNESSPSVDSLLLAARIERQLGDTPKALELLESAHAILRN